MTRAREIADLTSAGFVTDDELDSAVSSVAKGKNLLYNGAMQVAQRGTSATGLKVTDYYTADRWRSGFTNSTVEWTQTVEDEGPTESGFTKSLKVLCTTAQASLAQDMQFSIQQVLEGKDLQRIAKGTSGAQPMTLSFWVKSNVTGNYVATILDLDNSRHVSSAYQVNVSDTWEKKILTVPADLTGVFDNDNEASLRLFWYLGAGTDLTSGSFHNEWLPNVTSDLCPGQTNLAAAVGNYWQITGVQLEVGDTATEFEHKKYGTELLECQRYYQITGHIGGPAINTKRVGAWYTFPVRMRDTPSAELWSIDGTTQGAVSPYNGSNTYIGSDFTVSVTANRGASYARTTTGDPLTPGNFYVYRLFMDAEL